MVMDRRQQRAMFARMNNPNQRRLGLVIPNPNQPRRTLFFAPKDPRLARIIKIDTPSNFRKSIRILSKGGLTLKERRALILAQNRAKAQLGRKNLSPSERREFTEISREKILPTPTKLRTLRPVSATRVGAFKAVERRKELKEPKGIVFSVETKRGTKGVIFAENLSQARAIATTKGLKRSSVVEQNNDNKKPVFIKEPFGLPRELQPTGKFRRQKSSHQSGHNPKRKKKEVGIYSL